MKTLLRLMGVSHKTSTEGNLAKTIKFLNLYINSAVLFLGNYPMDIFTHIINMKDILCSVVCICDKTENHFNAHP